MKRNISAIDRIIRFLIAGSLLGVLAGGLAIGPIGIIGLLVISALLVITGAWGYCPLYGILKISTFRAPSGQPSEA